MMCYRDMSFCSAFPTQCGNATCGRAVTDSIKRMAAEWWGGKDPPIATIDLSDGCKTRIEPNGGRNG